MNQIFPYLSFDRLSITMIIIIAFVGTCVGRFASSYFTGDRKKTAFFVYLLCLICAVSLMVVSDNLLVFFVSWGLSNLLLSRLMQHKKEWKAAQKSARFAVLYLGMGSLLLGAGFFCFIHASGSYSISTLLQGSLDSPWIIVGASLVILSALIQSGIWPFHRWLTSSLNSPTPVSAIMHAGVVNGGGVLLGCIAPIILYHPILLDIIFIAGIITAFLGTLWKLMQHDIKRMLACSTMGQMGFMIAQCGLGLFPAAVAHLCFHSLFKAHLFLSSGGHAQDQRSFLEKKLPTLLQFLAAFACGIAGTYAFSACSGKTLLIWDTTLFLSLIALISGTQFSLTIIHNPLSLQPFATFLVALVSTFLMGSAYGLSVHLIEWFLSPLNIMVPQPLNTLHIAAFFLLLFSWTLMIFGPTWLARRGHIPRYLLKLYVQMLNGSQPHPDTVTAHRNNYKF